MSGEGAGPGVNAYRSRLCSTCVNIEFTFLELYRDLGTLEDITERSSKCPLCAFFRQLLAVEHIRSTVPERAMPDTEFNRYRFEGGGLRLPQMSPMFMPQIISVYSETRRPRGREFVVGCNHIPRARVGTRDHRAYLDRAGLPVDESTLFDEVSLTRSIDFDVLKAWLSSCESKHGASDQGARPGEDTVEVMLIDVVERCLVNADTAHQYTALSYVMGGVVGIQLTKLTLQSLTQAGALTESWEQIPAVIKDAIQVTKSLGIRYLWTDCLCIVQNDLTTKAAQIAKMDVIYSRAYLTLVSASGTNSRHGLNSLQSEPSPAITLTHEYRARLGNSDQCVQFRASPPSLLEILAASTYESRGWTLQERALSRRILYFTNWQLHYECRAGCHRSQLETGDDDETQAQPSVGAPGAPAPVVTDHLEVPEANVSELSLESAHPYEHAEEFEIYASYVESYTQRDLSYPTDILNAFQGIMNSLTIDRQAGPLNDYGLPKQFLEVALLWTPAERISLREVKLTEGVQAPSWSWAGWMGPVSYSYMIQNGYMRDYFRSEITWEDESAVAPDRHALRFCAFTAPWKAFEYTSGIRRQDFQVLEAGDLPALYIADSRGHCGVFLDYRDKVQPSSTLKPDDIEIILLSKTCLADVADEYDRTGFSLRFPSRHSDVWLKTFKSKAFRQGRLEQCLANVMWIRWTSGVAERIAVGVVHEDAWAAVQGKRKLITLL